MTMQATDSIPQWLRFSTFARALLALYSIFLLACDAFVTALELASKLRISEEGRNVS